MSEIILKRDKTGKTTVNGDTFNVPTTHTALSVIGSNNIMDGDDFRDDYWVYRNGKKVRKWFMKLRNRDLRIWPPRLDDIAKCEAKRWRWLQRCKTVCNPMWNKLYKDMEAQGDFGGFRVGTSKKAEGWIEFNVSNGGLGWSWVKEKPAKINQTLTQRYFEEDEIIMRYYQRSAYFHAAFMEAIENKFWAKLNEDKFNKTKLHLIINKRDYWFGMDRRSYCSCVEAIAMPEETHIIEKF